MTSVFSRLAFDHAYGVTHAEVLGQVMGTTEDSGIVSPANAGVH